MKWKLAALLAVLVFDIQAPAPAEACGVKLNVKSSKPKKAIARTSNPSHLLLLGSPPKKLVGDLSAAGHDVEVAPTPARAKRKQYAVVIVDNADTAAEARSQFGTSIVVVRSGNLTADARSVESKVARTPTRADESRTAVAAREVRTPVAAGPTPERRTVVSAADPETTVTPVKAEPKPAAVETRPAVAVKAEPRVVDQKPEPKIAKAEPRVVEQKPEPKAVPTSDPPPTADPKPAKTVASANLNVELFFGLGSADVRGAGIARAAKWLAAHPDVVAVIAGHADPTGTPEGNLALAQIRAEGVRDALVAAGVDASRLEVISYGDTRLKYGRADGRNRRVAIEPK
ncbi:MAG: OmpA/MotB domain protein [Myxococcales bacterium]|nr:OmpA/MotB domain protein [Myxococcales bacterium]